MDRARKPYSEVEAMLGEASCAWEKLVGYIRCYYVMDELWVEGKPTHKNYNNLYIRRGGKSLIILGVREGYFHVCVVLGKDERERFDAQRDAFGEAVCKEYDAAQTYHDGKWLGFEVRDESLVDDIIRLLRVKRKPNRKVLPGDLGKCGCLDLGLSHEDITNCLMSE